MKTSHLALTLLATLGSLLSCKQQEGQPAEVLPGSPDGDLVRVSARQFEANGMVLGSPEKRTFPEVIRASGTIDVPPENRVVISAVYGGYVKKTTLLEGDRVQKGQVLLTLENPEFLSLQQQYLEVSEQIPYLRSEFERQETLYREQISSQKVFLKAQSDYNTALARKSGLQSQLGMLGIKPPEAAGSALQSEIAIRAPIPGSVNRIRVVTGAYVSQATEIMEIVNTDHIHLEVLVFEQDISRIRKGQKIRFRVPELSPEVHGGSVHLIGSIVDENRTVKVHCHVDEEDLPGLMVGMFVQADILAEAAGEGQVDPKAQLALPEEAILSMESGDYVLVLDSATDSGYAFRRVPVKTGISAGGFIALSDPGELQPTHQVLLSGAFLLGSSSGEGPEE